METNTALDARSESAAADRALRRGAGVGVVLLIPTAVMCLIVTLASSRASRCLTYGEQCSTIPGEWILYAFVGSAVFGAVALALPRRRLPFATARGWIVLLQVGAHLTMAAVILAQA